MNQKIRNQVFLLHLILLKIQYLKIHRSPKIHKNLQFPQKVTKHKILINLKIVNPNPLQKMIQNKNKKKRYILIQIKE